MNDFKAKKPSAPTVPPFYFEPDYVKEGERPNPMKREEQNARPKDAKELKKERNC